MASRDNCLLKHDGDPDFLAYRLWILGPKTCKRYALNTPWCCTYIIIPAGTK